MSDKISINLEVFPEGRKYPLRIDKDDEELVREATRQLRIKFMQYREKYPSDNTSDKDIMAMVAIDIATNNLRLEKKNDTTPFITKIQKLNNELKEYLKGR